MTPTVDKTFSSLEFIRVPHLIVFLLIPFVDSTVDGARADPSGRRGDATFVASRHQPVTHASTENVSDTPELGLGLVTDGSDFTSWPTGEIDDGDAARWMSVDAAVVYPRTLRQLTLPGTHDSGAYQLTTQLMPDPRFPSPWAAAALALAERLHVPVDRIITPWALTQTLDVAAQLRAGYRYVDLRAGWNGSHWCAHHAEVGTPVVTILRDVARFMAEQPGEVVVVQVSHLDGFPTNEEVWTLAEMIGEELRGLLVPLPPSSVAREARGSGGVGGGEEGAGGGEGESNCRDLRLDRTVGDMVESGERVLVVFGDGDFASAAAVSSSTSSLYPFSHLWPPCTLHNSYADSDDPLYMVRYNRQQVVAFACRPVDVRAGSPVPLATVGQQRRGDSSASSDNGDGIPHTLFKISWTLTTQARTVLESVLPTHPKSLRELNELGEPLLRPFTEEMVAAGCRTGNILTVDFAATSDAVRAVRAMNALPVGVNCTLSLNARRISAEMDQKWHAVHQV